MKNYNYITKAELDSTKTYNRYVDVLVRLADGTKEFIEKAPFNKNHRKEVIFMTVGSREIKEIVVVSESYRLKNVWM